MSWLLFIGLCSPTWARTEGTGIVIDFEDLTVDPADPWPSIPDGYEGFTWNGSVAVDAHAEAWSPGGIGDVAARDVYFSSTTPFRFDGAWITVPGWGFTEVLVMASDGTDWVYEADVWAGGDRAYWFEFGWEGVTTVSIGVDYSVVVDDIYINVGADVDSDGDGVGDRGDTCPTTPSADQLDADADRVGDACEEDDDDDGVLDSADGCPTTADADQTDTDGDGAGDACDVCPDLADDQADADGDGEGDACDALYGWIIDFEGLDPDSDPVVPEGYGGLHLGVENLLAWDEEWGTDPGIRGELAAMSTILTMQGDAPFDLEGGWFWDYSGEGLGASYWGYDADGNEISGDIPTLTREFRWVTLDLHDVVYLEVSPDATMFAVDDLHINTDTWSDVDADGLDDRADRCPDDYDPDQDDIDDDFLGDACDEDRDGDGVLDDVDLCPGVADTDQPDGDADGVGDACDNCPDVANTDQANGDPDHYGDACDVYDGVTVDFEDLDPGFESDTIAIPEDYLGLTWTTDATAVTAGSPTAVDRNAEGVNGNVALLLPYHDGSPGREVGYLYLSGGPFSLLGLSVGPLDGMRGMLIIEEWRDGDWEIADVIHTEVGEAGWFDLDLVGVTDLRLTAYPVVIDDLYIVLPDADTDGVADHVDNCPLDGNADQSDVDGDSVGDTCDDDDDGDLVDDDLDLCPATPTGALVTDDGCDGRQYVDAACPAERRWPTLGAYVRCVAAAADRAVALGVATPAQRLRFVREAADGPL